MIKASLVVGSPALKNNRIFSNDPDLIRDDVGRPFILLRQGLLRLNIELATEDIHPPADAAISIALNILPDSPVSQCKGKRYVIITEPPCVLLRNWKLSNYEQFHKVFTYNDAWVDNKKIFLLRFPGNYGYGPIAEPSFDKKKFCALIAGFKTSSHPNELYSERMRAIRWFSDNHPDEFDLYGVGWPGSFRPKFHRYVERGISKTKFNRFVDLFFRKNRVYKGKIGSKREILSQYKFSICYENCKGEDGYITEKFFDCMGGGCIPVYRGADNLQSLVPDDCYINMGLFSNYEELHSYLHNMDEDDVKNIQKKMRQFLDSQAAEPFTPSYFAKKIAGFIERDVFSDKAQ